MEFLLKLTGVTLGYIVLAKIGLTFATTHGSVTLIWLAGGFALATVLTQGTKYLPVVFLGAFVAGLLQPLPMTACLGIALGNTLETALGYWLLTHTHKADLAISSGQDYGKILLWGATLPALCSALAGPLSLWLSGVVPVTELASIMLKWWMGDFLGIACITPIYLLLRQKISEWEAQPEWWETPAIWVISFLAGQAMFLHWWTDILPDLVPIPAWVLPGLIWASMSTSRKNIALLQTMLITQGVSGEYLGVGFFGQDMTHSGLLNFWLFLSIITIGGMRVAIVSNEKRHALWQLSMTAKVFEVSNDGILILDKNNRIQTVNRAFTTITGYSSAEVQGRDPSILSSGRHPPEFYADMWRSINATGEWSGEIWNRHKNKEMYLEFLSIHTVKNDKGRVINRIGSFRDITQQRQAEEALRKAKTDAEQANRAKSEFLAVMSHEIRTPMNAVLGFADIALFEVKKGAVKDYLQHIKNSGAQLLSLINNILNFSKIEAGHVELEQVPFSIEALMAHVISTTGVSLHGRNVRIIQELDGRIPAMLTGDPVRLIEIMTNLMSNAIKFTEHGEVKLSITHAGVAPSGLFLRIAISDSGIGMSQDQLEKLFQPFTQADASITRKYGGTGLGLSITKNLVEIMSGSIEVTSILGEGSCFTVVLPLHLCVCEECETDRFMTTSIISPTSPRFKREYKGMHALVVEDNELNQLVAQRILEKMGFEVSIAENGKEAIANVIHKHKKYDLIFMDMHMPEIDGIEATRTIRQVLDKNKLPIIAMTANVYEEHISTCLDAGMNSFITKPIQPEKLHQALADTLEK